mmetsp:Transcript_19996/g.37119  ORF Transcript_19996/g.37119 Transcript_19996/m.37119 type:complete len:477 (+) Transcript_19996:3422-4852(+)
MDRVDWKAEELLPRRIQYTTASAAKADFDWTSLIPWRERSGAGVGLQNYGNTCFLNATLQVLLHTPPLLYYSHTCKAPFCALCLLHQLKARRSNSPYDFIRNINRIGRQFRLGRQEDAHEFLRSLMERLQSKEFVREIFGGQLRSRVTCRSCQFTSDTNDDILDICLELQGQDLERCLGHFCRAEVLDGSNRYHCPVCKSKQPATKQFSLQQVPRVLTVQLKRFTNYGKKDMRTMHYPEELDLSRYSPGVGKYSLYGVLVHSGHSCHSGHYFSFVKAGNGLWYEMNDNSVSQASVGRVLNHSNAYILFYIQKIEHKPQPRPQVPDTAPVSRILTTPVAKPDKPPTANPEMPAISKPSIEEVDKADIEARNTDTGSESSDDRRKRIKEPEAVTTVVADAFAKLPRKRLGHCLHKASLKRICSVPESAPAAVELPRNRVESLGYVKDEYDRKLDIGRKRKLKKLKMKIPVSWWDSVRF